MLSVKPSGELLDKLTGQENRLAAEAWIEANLAPLHTDMCNHLAPFRRNSKTVMGRVL